MHTMDFEVIKSLDMWKEHIELEYLRDECVGCAICVQCCPKDALKLNPPGASVKGIIDTAPIELDEEKCVLCGVCVALCPRDALRILVNGEEKVLIVENKGLPENIEFEGRIEIDQEKCPKGCNVCQDICKEEAISVKETVEVDEDICIYCGACSIACPSEAIAVIREKLVYDELDTCEEIDTRIMTQVKDILIGTVQLESVQTEIK